MGCDVVNGGFVVDVGAVVVVGLIQGELGSDHWPAESEQLSIWPLGERQSLGW